MTLFLDADQLIEKIRSGYTINRVAKHTQKKTFAPSTIAFSRRVCSLLVPSLDGGIFEDNADAYGGANMNAGTKSHERIQEAMGNVPDFLIDSEFKITYENPPIFGYGDVMLSGRDKNFLAKLKQCQVRDSSIERCTVRPRLVT